MATPGVPVSLAKQRPTQRDADRLGAIFVFDGHLKCWMRQHWQNIPSHLAATHWMTPPPPPEKT